MENNMQWVSVEDKMPESNDWYLVFDEDEDITFGYFEGEMWWDHNPGEVFKAKLIKITHWMPSPEPPFTYTEEELEELVLRFYVILSTHVYNYNVAPDLLDKQNKILNYLKRKKSIV